MKNLELINDINENLKERLLEGDYTVDEVEALINYIMGRVSLEEIDYKFAGEEFRKVEVDYYKLQFVIDSVKKLFKEDMETYERYIVSMGLIKYYLPAVRISGEDKYFPLLKKHNVPVKVMIDNLVLGSLGGNFDFIYESIKWCIKKDNIKTHKLVKESIYPLIVKYVDILMENDNEEAAKLVFDMLDCEYKRYNDEVEEMIKANTAYSKYVDIINERIRKDSLKVRERFVRILISYYKEEKVKQEIKDKIKNMCLDILSNEKSKNIKFIITSEFNLENKDEETSKVEELLHKNKRVTFKWMDLKNLTKVRFKEKEDFASEDYLKALISCYGTNNTIYTNDEGEELAAKLNKEDLSIFALEVFHKWIEDGSAAKKKYALNFAANFGDDNFIHEAEKYINEWAGNSRTALAKEAVNSLAVSKADEAPILLDKISNKFKSKAVKNTAKEAMAKLAENLNMSKEELGDRLIPNFGFDINGERIFDYGETKVKVILNSDLTLSIYDNKDKKIKTLPKGSKNDEENKIKECKEEFKILKKSLKSTYDIQKRRLSDALRSERKWTKDLWVNTFINNPVMSRFATEILWGVYDNNKLQDTFRYGEDGSFNTIDEEDFEFEVNENSRIGVVHPMDLKEAEIQKWKEQFENYEIVQPINQLDRKVFTINEIEMKARSIERFGGKIINGIKALKILEAYGWERGPILEGLHYEYFCKEIKEKRIRIELSFDELIAGHEYDMDATIFKLKFYKMNNKAKNNYRYEDIKDAEYLIRPEKIPARIFSETLYEVDKMLNSSSGFDKEWKRKA